MKVLFSVPVKFGKVTKSFKKAANKTDYTDAEAVKGFEYDSTSIKINKKYLIPFYLFYILVKK